jgi:hypothetical protein
MAVIQEDFRCAALNCVAVPACRRRAFPASAIGEGHGLLLHVPPLYMWYLDMIIYYKMIWVLLKHIGTIKHMVQL